MSEDTKTALKEARDLVKAKDYQGAIKKCKQILKGNKSNYSALILLGAAMKELPEFKCQAPLAFRKAIEIQANNPLAWQGLVAHYERNLDGVQEQAELAFAYCKLLTLEENPVKFSSLLDKLSNLSLRLQHDKSFSEIIQALEQLRETITAEKQQCLDKTLAWMLTESSHKKLEFNNLLQTVLASVTKDSDIANRREYFAIYLRILYETAQFHVLQDEATMMHQLFSEDIRPLEWICRLYYEKHVSKDSTLVTDSDIAYYYETLLKLNSQSTIGCIAKALHLMESGNFIEAREHLTRITATGQLMFYTCFLLSQIHEKLYCWEDAERASKQALELAKIIDDTDTDHSSRLLLKLRLIECLLNSKDSAKWNTAREKCNEMLKQTSTSSQLQMLLMRAKILLDEPHVTEELSILESDEDETRTEVIHLRALYFWKHKQLEQAKNLLLDSKFQTTVTWSLLGNIYWELADYNNAQTAFLNAVQADRNNWKCFVQLGHYYSEHAKNVERARRCYQRALLINPNSEDAGIGLSTAYRCLNDKDANMQLLQRITAQENAPKWAWLQLGLQYLNEGEATEAIRALQCAIRADPYNNHSWESLGDAYQIRGAHTSALRAYERALKLSPESLYPMIQLANVKLVIGQYEEAKNDFQCILEKEGHYVAALKGLAEAYLALARYYISKQRLCRAKENLQLAADNLTLAILQRNDVSCLWKLLGDACYLVATMSDKYSHLQLSGAFTKESTNAEQDLGKSTIDRQCLFIVSSRCYCRALTLSRDSSLLWHDLACCYFAQSQYEILANNEIEPDQTIGKKPIDLALAAAKRAVTLSPTSWSHWNILGVICMSDKVKNFALAQHSFIMATDNEPNNAITWTNLGTLYLLLGDPYLANEAFSRAQRADPAYVNSWVGQALIAEKMNRKDAMDLFRHSLELGYHDQAVLGYAHWVLTALLDRKSMEDPLYTYIIENMHAIPVASDALHWFNERHPHNSYALNAHGLLLERLGLYRTAAERFESALSCCKTVQKDSVRVNLSRILINLTRYTDAVDICRTVEKADFNSQCHLALALFKADRYEESYEAYETALHWLTNKGSDKAHILCAMAAIAHIFQGADDAKTLLFQCLQIQPPTVAGYLSAAALGILHNDVNLTTLVLNELKPFTKEPEYRHHVATLSAYALLLKDNVVGAIRLLCSTIHQYPSETDLWVSLVRLLSATGATPFVRCVRKALYLSRNTPTANRLSMHITYAMSIANDKSKWSDEQVLKSTQRTIFIFPGYSESWANFIAALLARNIRSPGSRPNLHWLFTLISLVLDTLPTTTRLAKWLHKTSKSLHSSLKSRNA